MSLWGIRSSKRGCGGCCRFCFRARLVYLGIVYAQMTSPDSLRGRNKLKRLWVNISVKASSPGGDRKLALIRLRGKKCQEYRRTKNWKSYWVLWGKTYFTYIDTYAAATCQKWDFEYVSITPDIKRRSSPFFGYLSRSWRCYLEVKIILMRVLTQRELERKK